jgi:hypothetical protein
MAETNPLMDILKSVGETVSQAAPGLSLGNILSDVGAELKQMGAHGAHELSAAIFNGSSYVMYPRGQHDDKGQTVEAPAVDTQAIEEQSRGGRSM